MISQQEAVQIAKTLISNNFPELQSKRINYVFVSGKKHDYYMAVLWLIFSYRVLIEKEVLKFSRQAFTGCLAHEFAHLVIEAKKSFFRRLWEPLAGTRKEGEERSADMLAIERGCGEAVLQFNKEHEKEYEAYVASEGMTKREIKKMLKTDNSKKN